MQCQGFAFKMEGIFFLINCHKLGSCSASMVQANFGKFLFLQLPFLPHLFSGGSSFTALKSLSLFGGGDAMLQQEGKWAETGIQTFVCPHGNIATI